MRESADAHIKAILTRQYIALADRRERFVNESYRMHQWNTGHDEAMDRIKQAEEEMEIIFKQLIETNMKGTE